MQTIAPTIGTKEDVKNEWKLESTKVVDQLVRSRRIPVIRLGHRTLRFDMAKVRAALAKLETQAI